MNEIEKLNMIAEWQKQHKQLIQDLDNSKKRILELEKENAELQEENGKSLQRITQLEKDVTENESDCSMCDFPKLKQDLEKENKQLKQRIKYWIAEYEKLFNED